MPELAFSIAGVEPVMDGLAPLLRFELRITNQPATGQIRGAFVHAQLQLEPTRRRYSAEEKQRLVDLFGTPERWGQTLRNRLWTHVDATVPPFAGETRAALWVPCTFDLNVAAAKYFHALDAGDVSVLFLFSGTVFFAAADGRLQAELIDWGSEARFAFPAGLWRELMERHFPGSGWLSLRRDVFERVYRFKREHGLPTWDEALEELLARAGERAEVPA